MNIPPLRSMSAEPGLASASNQGRATSLDRGRTRSKHEHNGRRSGTLPADMRRKAKVIRTLDPAPDFASLRRGFTLNGQPILAVPKQALKHQADEDVTWLWWTIYIFILVLGIGNIVTSIVIARILGVGLTGLDHIEVYPDENKIVLWGDMELHKLYHRKTNIYGYEGENLTIAGGEGEGENLTTAGSGNQLHLHAFGEEGPALRISKSAVALQGIHDFNLIDAESKENFFSTSDPHWKIPKRLNEMKMDLTETADLVSPLHQPLDIQSSASANIRGAEGLGVVGRVLNITATQSIVLESVSGGLHLNGGFTLNTVLLPLQGGPNKNEEYQRLLCVCMPSGKLFQIAEEEGRRGRKTACLDFEESKDPCK